MYKHCATEESVQRQRQLEQCLQELMLTEEYPHITISHICDRAGIARKSFYRYFSSKEGCLCALLDHAIFDGASYYLPGQDSRHAALFYYERFFYFWKEKRDLLEALLRNGLSTRLIERLVIYVMQEEQDFRLLLKKHGNDTHECCLFYIGGIMTMVFNWHLSGYRKSVSQMAHILSDLI